MKRIFTTMLVALAATALMAQMNIWYNGSIVYRYDYTRIDSITFDIQDPEEPPTPQPTLDDGVYLLGEATAAADFEDPNAHLCRMGQGRNEVEQQARRGMYEKFVALEAGKDFEIVVVENNGTSVRRYGAQLVMTEIPTDADPITNGLKGAMEEDLKLRVIESGLYHVIVDFNMDNKLDNPLVMVVPCYFWGIRGAMNGWGYTEASERSGFDKMTMNYTWKNVLVEQDGVFKFTHGHYWKVNMDLAEYVKAESSLGPTGSDATGASPYCVGATDMMLGGGNFQIDAGYHDITLTWFLNSGKPGDNFMGNDIKTADYSVDGTSQVISLIGSAIENDPKWETDADLTYEGIIDGYYSYSIKDYKLYAGDLVVRLDHNWVTNWRYYDMQISGDDNNIYMPVEGYIGVRADKTYSKISFRFTVENNVITDRRLIFEP